MIDEHHAPIPAAVVHPADPGGSPTRCCAGRGRNLRPRQPCVSCISPSTTACRRMRDWPSCRTARATCGSAPRTASTATTATPSPFKNDPDNPASLSNNSIIALHEDRRRPPVDRHVGRRAEPLRSAQQQFTRYQHDPANPISLSDHIVTDIIQDEQGAIWIGTLGGLDRFDPTSGTSRTTATIPTTRPASAAMPSRSSLPPGMASCGSAPARSARRAQG